MATQSITFDFLSRGAASLSRDFRSIGDDSALSSRGVKVLSDVIEKLGAKEDRTAAESKLLAKALRETGDAADRATAKAVLADAAIGRLGAQMKDAETKSSGLNKALGNLKPNPGLAGPLLALVPALGTLTGVAAGLGVGLAGAFVAGGGALAAFGAVAKPVLSDALKASQAVNTAQNNYSIAIANGTKQAVAYKAEQIAIGKAYAELSPAQIKLSQQLGNMANAWQAVKTAQTPVVAGALQPWLKSVTDLTKNLAPIIAAVSPVIKALGVQFDALVNSAAFKGFRDFIAGTGSQVVRAAGGTIIDLVKSFMILLPKFNPLILGMTGGIAAIGPAVLKWASSQKTADQITAFMGWFTKNGPVVGGLLTNIAGALKALAPGLSSGGALELKLISDFFGLVAKLPASFAKPLTEVAGTLLILSKLGVLKVGVQIVGAAAKWLTGGLVNLGGGAAAGAEIRAAMVSGGAAAAAEIRAAMTGGGAAAGAEGAAGGAAGKTGAAGGAAAAGAAALGVAAAGAFAGALIKAVGDTLSPHGTFAGKLNQMFQGLSGPVSTSVLHAFTFGGLEAWVTAKIGQPVGAALNATGKFIQNTWATIWANTIGGASNDGKRLVATITGTYNAVKNFITGSWNQTWAATRNVIDAGLGFLAGSWRKLASDVTSAYTTVRTSIASAWNTIWANTRAVISTGIAAVAGFWRNLEAGTVLAFSNVRTSIANAWNTIWAGTRLAVSGGITTVVNFFKALPGNIVSALGAAGKLLVFWGSGVINGLLAGAKSVWQAVVNFFLSVPKAILNALGIKSPPQWAIDAGRHIMNGIGIGVDFAKGVVSKATAAAIQTAATGGIAGPGGGAPAANAALARKMMPAWGSGAEWAAWNYLEMREAGWNQFARNPSSGAYGIPQALPPSKMGAAANPPQSNPAAQISWMIGYIRQRYGDPINAAAHERAFNWYASGTASALPGWAWVGERGPEMVRFRGGEQVIPAGRGGDAFTALIAEVRALRGEVRQLTGVAAAIPARTGQHVGGAIASGAGAAGFRRRYPAGGA